mmetsp:Transcript_16872/g.42904  ORF Transcript_16872/g.42904 Transcript_16872/m.42904 type:complete len:315 (-) Transcript_16872:420-1364(-)
MGMHSGNVMGVPYFNCAPKHGIMAKPEQVQGGGTTQNASVPLVDSALVAVPEDVPVVIDESEEIETLPAQEGTDGSVSLGKNVSDGSDLGTSATSTPPTTPVPVKVAAASSEEEEEEDLETLPSQEKTADGRLWLGLEVVWSGKQGVVRYIGPVKFASGEWVGLEMIEAKGMHDGSVMGVPYFRCPPQMGVFAPPEQVQTSGTADEAVVAQAMREAEAAASEPADAAAAAEAPASTAAESGFKVGQRVVWSGKHPGTVQYVGPVKFAAGEWVGVELDSAVGRHDGHFMGVTYFECEAMRGVFCQESMLSVMAAA